MSLQRHAEARLRLQAWAGDRSRLARLCEIASELLQEPLQRELETARASLHERRGAYSTAAQLREAMKKEWPPLRDQIIDVWRVDVEATEPDQSLSYKGPPEVVLDEMDPPAVRSLRVQAPLTMGADSRIDIRMSRSDGCILEVKSDDPGWMRKARFSMEAELRRGMPNWAQLRSDAVSLAVSTLAAVIAGGVLLVGSYRDAGEMSGTALLLVLLLVPVLGMGVGPRAIKAALPGFEVLDVGTQSRGTRVVAVFAGLVAQILIAVVITAIFGFP